jgi:hypothetical protein
MNSSKHYILLVFGLCITCSFTLLDFCIVIVVVVEDIQHIDHYLDTTWWIFVENVFGSKFGLVTWITSSMYLWVAWSIRFIHSLVDDLVRIGLSICRCMVCLVQFDLIWIRFVQFVCLFGESSAHNLVVWLVSSL